MTKYVCKECGNTAHDLSCKLETESMDEYPLRCPFTSKPQKRAHFIELEDD
jgi:hypothetical protein